MCVLAVTWEFLTLCDGDGKSFVTAVLVTGEDWRWEGEKLPTVADGGCDFKGDNVMAVSGTSDCDGSCGGYDANFVTVGGVTDVGGIFCDGVLVLVVMEAGVFPCGSCGSVIPEETDVVGGVSALVTNGGGDGGSLDAVVTRDRCCCCVCSSLVFVVTGGGCGSLVACVSG